MFSKVTVIQKLYEKRFSKLERVHKEKLWQILCNNFLQKFIDPNSDVVVDLGAGNCEFINNIHAKKKYAVDLNIDTKQRAKKDVTVISGSIKYLEKFFSHSRVDVIFMSNLLEHLDSKEEVFRLLTESYTVLASGGRVLILQPDIKLVGSSYWDFFDHKVPLTLASLTEALVSIGFQISFVRYPFLPYSTKVRFIPLWPVLFELYLRLRPLHFIFGKQFFLSATKI